MIKILIAGDIVPTQSNYDLFEKGTVKELLGDKLETLWNKADLRIANLEAPIIDAGYPISKSGPNLSIPTRCIPGLKRLGITLFGLANNHIMDFGEEGLRKTFELLDRHDISYVGAGSSKEKAEKGTIIQEKGIRLGIYACSEHEFSAAQKNAPGANAIGINTCLRIHELKAKTDFLIVLFHGGKEHYPYPTPAQQERCHYFVDAGADLVVCQHSHCIGCEEEYLGGTVIYGQGNFIFDYKDEECWKSGILIEVNVASEAGHKASVCYHPFSKVENSIRYSDQSEEIMEKFRRRSTELYKIDELYDNIVKKHGPFMARGLFGWNRFLRGFDRFIMHGKLVEGHARKNAKSVLGVVKCETNNEIAEKYIEGLY